MKVYLEKKKKTCKNNWENPEKKDCWHGASLIKYKNIWNSAIRAAWYWRSKKVDETIEKPEIDSRTPENLVYGKGRISWDKSLG